MENSSDVLIIRSVNILENKKSIKKGHTHVCPMRTKIVNHHVYKHTYQPSYSCCEENVCSEVQCGSCCNFR